jgi:hypothetical protein
MFLFCFSSFPQILSSVTVPLFEDRLALTSLQKKKTFRLKNFRRFTLKNLQLFYMHVLSFFYVKFTEQPVFKLMFKK